MTKFLFDTNLALGIPGVRWNKMMNVLFIVM